MKQTAVEWLCEQYHLKQDIEIVKQAKEMEKQQQGYSKEEAIAFSKWCAELKVWDNETYVNNTFETLFEQFKNK